MNPLNKYPKIREALYLVQWVVTGIQTVASAVLALVLGEPTEWPQWYVVALAVTPVVWTYLGLTAKATGPQPVAANAVSTSDTLYVEDEADTPFEGFEDDEDWDLPTDTLHGGNG